MYKAMIETSIDVKKMCIKAETLGLWIVRSSSITC